MSNNKTSFYILASILVAALAAAGGFMAGRQNLLPFLVATGVQETSPQTMQADDHAHHDEPKESAGHNDKEKAEKDHDGEAHGADDGHGHGAEVSDLDRPVAEMWAASCEHNIPQYQCDECRYEIGAVKLDASLLGASGLVQTGFPEKRPAIKETLTLPGEVQLDETRTVHVSSPLTGRIVRGFTAPGAVVEAGAPLFEVDSSEVAEAKSGFIKARASHALARKTAEREALLFSKKIAAEVEVQEAEAKRAEAETEVAAARGRLQRLGLGKAEVEVLSAEGGTAALHGLIIVRAPRAGTIIEGHANPGEHAETGKELLTLSDLGTVWILADLKEAELAVLAGAEKAAAEIVALGRTFPGKLDTVAGRMSEETRTAKARFIVKNEEGLLKPGLFVSVRLLLPGGGETLAVPKVTVLADAGRTFVFVHKEGDFWVRRPVTLGKRFGGLVEIASGLDPTQRIITDGSFLLKSDVLRSKMGAGCAD